MANSVWVVFDVGFRDIDGYYAQYESLAVVCDSESSARNFIVNKLRARKKEARNRYLYEKDRFAIWAVEDDGEFSSFEIWLKEHDYDFPDKDRIIKDEPFIYHSEFGEVGYMYSEQEVRTVFTGGGTRKRRVIKMDMRFAPKPLEPTLTVTRTKDDELIHGILEALSYAGIYGEEATIGLIEVLKRIHRPDLLPPCERNGD